MTFDLINIYEGISIAPLTQVWLQSDFNFSRDPKNDKTNLNSNIIITRIKITFHDL